MNSTWVCKKIPSNHNIILLHWLEEIHYDLLCKCEIWRWKCCRKGDNDDSTQAGKLPVLWNCLLRTVSIRNCSVSWPCPMRSLCLRIRKYNGRNWSLKQQPSGTYVSEGKMCFGNIYSDIYFSFSCFIASRKLGKICREYLNKNKLIFNWSFLMVTLSSIGQ